MNDYIDCNKENHAILIKIIILKCTLITEVGGRLYELPNFIKNRNGM